MRAWLLNVLLGLGLAVGFNLLVIFWTALISIKAIASVFHYMSTQIDPWIGLGAIIVFALLFGSVRTDMERHRGR